MDPASKNSGAKEQVFYVRVQFRCNSSMQGTINWLDGKKSSHFRSVLELGNLLGSALATVNRESGNLDIFRDWEDKESIS